MQSASFQLLQKLKGFGDVRIRYLEILIYIERILSSCKSDDYERYVKMGLRIEPQNAGFLDKRGHGLEKSKKIFLGLKKTTATLNTTKKHMRLLMARKIRWTKDYITTFFEELWWSDITLRAHYGKSII